MGFWRKLGFDYFKIFVIAGVYYLARESCSELSLTLRVIVLTLCLQITVIFLGQLEKAVLPNPSECTCSEPAAATTKN
ncbi:unnamed protein product [Linum trigynum]|uniref:Uncharacterized protein n=1 Tax=Linum trigynum TaxID=586398 RepID=A0AAV2D7C2_9ROSI